MIAGLSLTEILRLVQEHCGLICFVNFVVIVVNKTCFELSYIIYFPGKIYVFGLNHATNKLTPFGSKELVVISLNFIETNKAMSEHDILNFPSGPDSSLFEHSLRS